jgi:hypothetical protein
VKDGLLTLEWEEPNGHVGLKPVLVSLADISDTTPIVMSPAEEMDRENDKCGPVPSTAIPSLPVEPHLRLSTKFGGAETPRPPQTYVPGEGDTEQPKLRTNHYTLQSLAPVVEEHSHAHFLQQLLLKYPSKYAMEKYKAYCTVFPAGE